MGELETYPMRPVAMGPARALVRETDDGSAYLTVAEELGPYPKTLTDRLVHWATTDPNRLYLSERTADGVVREITYGEALTEIVRIGAGLLARGLCAERPLMILSENSIENALLHQAALHVGTPYIPVSPSYSLALSDHEKLKALVAFMNPGLIYAEDGDRYAAALSAVAGDREIVTLTGAPHDRQPTPFSALSDKPDDDAVIAAHDRITPDDIAKFLFTSGTTGMPKAVIFPHRMIASQRQQVAQTIAYLQTEPVRHVDWLPWHHTFGGTQNVGLTIYSGGHLRIDHGRPIPGQFDSTIQNLREVPINLYQNTPMGLGMLVDYLERDPELRKTFFRDLKLIFFGGATLATHIWKKLDRLAIDETGERVMITTGMGCTEAGPIPMAANRDSNFRPLVGVPVPGCEARIFPVGEKLELRLKGPCVTPGYWKDPVRTREAFDTEGFYMTGDAVTWIDPADKSVGLKFDGRIAENFKLDSGTWVQVADLRAHLIDLLAPLIQDAVIAEPGRSYLTTILFPDVVACREFAGLTADAPPETVVASTRLQDEISRRIAQTSNQSGGASSRIMRFFLTAEPATIESGELSDKRAISQKTVLSRRKDTLEKLYSDPPATGVVVVGQ